MTKEKKELLTKWKALSSLDEWILYSNKMELVEEFNNDGFSEFYSYEDILEEREIFECPFNYSILVKER